MRAEELEAEKWERTYTKSSWVSLEVVGTTTPSFGRVQHFFQHTFACQCHNFAVVNLYGRPQQDARSKLWYVPTTNVAERSVVKVSKLSKPLVTARDTDKMWFLNFIYVYCYHFFHDIPASLVAKPLHFCEISGALHGTEDDLVWERQKVTRSL